MYAGYKVCLKIIVVQVYRFLCTSYFGSFGHEEKTKRSSSYVVCCTRRHRILFLVAQRRRLPVLFIVLIYGVFFCWHRALYIYIYIYLSFSLFLLACFYDRIIKWKESTVLLAVLYYASPPSPQGQIEEMYSALTASWISSALRKPISVMYEELIRSLISVS